MNISRLRHDQIDGFIELATTEQWLVEPWELEFLLEAFPDGCHAARDAGGTVTGYVTALRHERSGWIGNLIVAPQSRGQGVGGALFCRALQALRSAGAETVWLTASPMGQALYERHGFRCVDTILRWTGCGRGRFSGHDRETAAAAGMIDRNVVEIDSRAWGDCRRRLLEATAARGRVSGDQDGFIVRQPAGRSVQLGPFAARNGHAAAGHLRTALAGIPRGTQVYLDAPAANRAAGRLYCRQGMRIAGSSQLMYCGRRPDYRPELLYGLASMGSCG